MTVSSIAEAMQRIFPPPREPVAAAESAARTAHRAAPRARG
jgi:hypothetical protein